MTSRERVLDSLNFKETSKVPVDFNATAVTAMHVSCVAALREYYGLEKKPVKVWNQYLMLGLLDDDLKECIGIDTVAVPGRGNLLGLTQQEWKEWRTPHGLCVLMPKDFATTEDENNIYAYPMGDTTVRPSAKMPKSGHFFDAIIRQKEFYEESCK